MKKKIAIILFFVTFVAIIVVLAKVFIIDRGANAFSGLKIDSIPQTSIYLDNKPIGKTPYENKKLTPGEYTLRLSDWETKIKLIPQSLTYVNRVFGKNDSESGHQIVWLEKLPNSKALELAIVASPDGATIEVDGLDVGTSPKIVTSLGEGDHKIIVSKDGFADQVIDGQLLAGFRLNISAKLARMNTKPEIVEKIATDSAKPATESSSLKTPYILVNETGLGFLRVRFEPSVTASETGRVNVGEKFPLLAEQSGWTQIKIGTSSGWVNDQYIEKFK